MVPETRLSLKRVKTGIYPQKRKTMYVLSEITGADVIELTRKNFFYEIEEAYYARFNELINLAIDDDRYYGDEAEAEELIASELHIEELL